MNILITGGNTYVPIDKVRGITNIFKGKTACDIAIEALAREHSVILLGNPGMSQKVRYIPATTAEFKFEPYKTYDELYTGMRDVIMSGWPHVVIHSAAVSDYRVARIYPTPKHDWKPMDRKHALPEHQYVCARCKLQMHPENDMVRCVPDYLQMNGKISSSHDSLTMELEPTEKIVDRIRDPWAFQGTLVKFKLQVDMSDDELLSVAGKSKDVSKADIMVANCLEWAREYAYILEPQGISRVVRTRLAATLLEKIEDLR